MNIESVIRDIYSLKSVFKKKKMHLFSITLLLFTFNLSASIRTCDKGITYFVYLIFCCYI